MRGYYSVTSRKDPRWGKSGRDFICPHDGALNFSMQEHVDRLRWKLGCEPPDDLKYFVYWDEHEKTAD